MTTVIERPVLGGTDGFRGVATEEAGPGRMNAETVAGLTRALIEYRQEAGFEGPVVVAQDTRPSGLGLREAAIAAAVDARAETIDAGTLPTPAAQKIAGKVGALATVVISASHNPWTDNGWKGMLGNRKPSEAENKDISERYWRQVESGLEVPIARPAGIADEQAGWREWYTAEVVADLTREFGSQPLSGRLFVLDGAHGAGARVTPEVFRRLGAEVEEFCCDEGLINDGCGATHLEGLKGFLQDHPEITRSPNFVGALANDGDADRVMGVGLSESGELVDITGNHIMEALALDPQQPGIVGTLYTNSGMQRRIESQGVEFEECKNGDKYVTSALLAHQQAGEPWTRGGEFSGHLIDTTWLDSGDGVRMAAWFAAHAVRAGKTFGEIHTSQPLWPEYMHNAKLPEGATIDVGQSPFIQRAIARVLAASGRPVVRASGTEPLLRAWFETPDRVTFGNVKSYFASSINQAVHEAAQ